MKYMTFNSSCSYAGVANMLAQYHFAVDDRTIAMGMKLPYLFTYEDGVKTITWHDNEYAYIISCDSKEIEISILVDIAESVR